MTDNFTALADAMKVANQGVINWTAISTLLPILMLFLLLFMQSGGMPIKNKILIMWHSWLIEKKNSKRKIVSFYQGMSVSLFNMSSSMITLNESYKVMRLLEKVPKGTKIDMVLNTPGGMVLAAQQIAQAISEYKGEVNVFVPQYAMSGGTLIALAANKIYLAKNAVLGAVDPQLSVGLFEQYPACSIVKAMATPNANRDDKMLVMVDVAEKALKQLKDFVFSLLIKKLTIEKARELASLLTQGTWTHDNPITYDFAKSLGLWVEDEIPQDMGVLLNSYPISAPSIYYRQPKKQAQVNSIKVVL